MKLSLDDVTQRKPPYNTELGAMDKGQGRSNCVGNMWLQHVRDVSPSLGSWLGAREVVQLCKTKGLMGATAPRPDLPRQCTLPLYTAIPKPRLRAMSLASILNLWHPTPPSAILLLDLEQSSSWGLLSGYWGATPPKKRLSQGLPPPPSP